MNIYQKIKPKAHLSRNGFDLSHRTIFSAKVGQILPIMCKEVVPGDHFEISASALTRTQTLNTAAFARLHQYFHFFFVSYQSLWHNWDTFISQQNNYESSYHKGSSFVPVFDLTDAFTSFKNESESVTKLKDVVGLPAWRDRFRLLDLLGYGKYCFDSPAGTTVKHVFNKPGSYKPNAFPILAYNKIYYDYYSDPYYEENDPAKYNADQVDCKTEATSVFPFDSVLEMRYRNFKKDYFTGLLPDTQFGAVSSVGLTPSLLTVTPSPASGVLLPANANLQTMQAGLTSGVKVGPASVGLVNGISILDLRKAQALQRWKETTLRAGRRHADQALAHFGVAPKDYRDNHARYLGGFDEMINIGEVVSSADTSGSKGAHLGEIAGKGVGAMRGDRISFDASEFGVIMCCYSCIPEADYNAYGMKRNLSFTKPFDFFTPEFENLGLEAVHFYEYDNRGTGGNTVLGYGPRYSYYKTAYDEVHGEFCSAGSLSAWTTPRIEFSTELVNGLTNRFLKVDPRVCDPIFAMMQPENNGGNEVKADQYVDESFDQLLINCSFDVKAVRPMSVIGMPSV